MVIFCGLFGKLCFQKGCILIVAVTTEGKLLKIGSKSFFGLPKRFSLIFSVLIAATRVVLPLILKGNEDKFHGALTVLEDMAREKFRPEVLVRFHTIPEGKVDVEVVLEAAVINA